MSPVAYSYDNDGNLATVYDSATGITTTYYYDLLGRALYYTKQGANLSQTVYYTYNAENNLESLTETVGNSTQGYVYTYDDANRITSVTVGDTTVTYTYDAFNRLTQKVTKQGETTVKTEVYTFVDWTDSEGVARTTSQIATYAVTVGGATTTYSYTYDDNGNILTISDGTHTTSYVYDSANQLVRENNQAANYTYTWTYDNAGNILTRTEYAYTTGNLTDIVPADTVNYTYDDATWGDLLTSYDGNAITYDGIGNPLTWGNRTFTWERGRQLAALTENGVTWSYTYGADGLRTGRTDGTTTYSYVYNGSQLVQMTVGNDVLRFAYDATGTPLSVNYNGTTYYYVTNIQGDVVAIVNASGEEQVRYTYGAWGQLLATEGTLATTLGANNPIRYRGYVYDQETALYYLQSRYYDPVVGRFINADNYPSTGQGFSGNNMFAYCGNNPVVRVDVTGQFFEWIVAAACVVSAVVSGVSNAIATAQSGGSITDCLIAGLVGAGSAVVGFAVAAAGGFSFGSNVAGRAVASTLCNLGTAYAINGKITEADIAKTAIDVTIDTCFSTITYYYTEPIKGFVLNSFVNATADGMVDIFEEVVLYTPHQPTSTTVPIATIESSASITPYKHTSFVRMHRDVCLMN